MAALAVVLAACGGGPPVGSPSPSTSASAGTSPAPTTSIAPQARLTSALDAFADGYRFESIITVGSVVATHATGRRVGGNAEFIVESAGTQITYRVVGAMTWVQRPGAAWVVVDGPAASADPLAALRSPTTLDLDPSAAGGGALVATYPAKALGLPGTDASTVSIAVGSDGSLIATYELTTSAGPATSKTTFQALTDTSPITPPK
jgi:hypothetical protein